MLIGAGNLGRALLSYGGFSDYGLEIVAAFDRSESVVGSAAGGKIVLPLSDLGRVCEHKRVQLGILTVPASEAQKAADQLVGHGINLFMSSISSFVHPMRLTFVEFYKNAGFEMSNRSFDPLRKLN